MEFSKEFIKKVENEYGNYGGDGWIQQQFDNKDYCHLFRLLADSSYHNFTPQEILSKNIAELYQEATMYIRREKILEEFNRILEEFNRIKNSQARNR